MNWSGQRPILTAEQARIVRDIAEQKAKLPSWSSLARQWGVSASTVQHYAKRLPKRYG